MVWPFKKSTPAPVEAKTPTVSTPRVHRQRPVRLRAYQGAKVNDMTYSMARSTRPVDGDIRRALKILRARSREEYQSNDYAKGAVRLFKNNVVGHNGIVMRSRAMYANGNPDRPARDTLEGGWKRFCKRGVPEVTRRHSWRGCLELIVQSLVVDGECIMVGRPGMARNEFGWAFEFVDPELLDHELNEDLKNGNIIRMGVELDSMGAPAAYHFLPNDRLKDDYQRQTFRQSHVRVPASQVMHVFLPEYVTQTRGVPWMATALIRAGMMRGYEEAELVAARVASSMMGAWEEAETGAQFTGDELDDDDPDTATHYLDAAEPGVMSRIPHGAKLHTFDPTHPTQQFPFYLKTLLRGFSVGVGVPYNSIANDLEGVNFSSLRQGNLDARDTWTGLQELLIEGPCDWVYENWLENALLANVLELRPGTTLSSFSRPKYLDIRWQPRTWEHVQPREQEMANQMQLGMRSKTVSQLIRDKGLDPDEVFDEWAEDIQKMRDRGIPLPEIFNDATTTQEEADDDEPATESSTANTDGGDE